MTPSPSELRFASLVTYCPRGDGDVIRRSQTLVRQVKENRMLGAETTAAFVARRLVEISPTFLTEFLGADAVLVPIPRSSLQRSGALWPALEIAEALKAVGCATRVIKGLKRRTAVTKAATARPNERPRAKEHLESLDVLSPLDLPASVTLVDDVVTRGAQLFGAAWRLWSVRPDITVRAFAVIRTITDPTSSSSIADPRVGTIRWRDGDCYRSP